MPCDYSRQLNRITDEQRREQERVRIEQERKTALAKLETGLRRGTVTLTVDRRTGTLALQGWTERAGLLDGCALDALMRRGSVVLGEKLSMLGVTHEAVRVTHGH